jgi:hypothetical protein
MTKASKMVFSAMEELDLKLRLKIAFSYVGKLRNQENIMRRLPQFFGALLAVVISDGITIGSAQAQAPSYFVARRYTCASANNPDAGDRQVQANGSSCAASRQAINESVQNQGGDPCHFFDVDWHKVKCEEIQVSACAPVPCS